MELSRKVANFDRKAIVSDELEGRVLVSTVRIARGVFETLIVPISEDKQNPEWGTELFNARTYWAKDAKRLHNGLCSCYGVVEDKNY